MGTDDHWIVKISPGGESVRGSTEEQAIENMQQFLIDCGIYDLDPAVIEEHNGRYRFQVGAEILMPGLPLETVRWRDLPGQSIWKFPRLYIDGNSWLWYFAVHIMKEIVHERFDTLAEAMAAVENGQKPYAQVVIYVQNGEHFVHWVKDLLDPYFQVVKFGNIEKDKVTWL